MLQLLAVILSFSSLSSLTYAKPISAEAANAGAQSVSAAAQGKLASEGSTTYDGVSLAAIPAAPAAAQVISAAISQAGWTITVSSANTATNNGGPLAIDGSTTSFWHSQYEPTLINLPHTATIDMKNSYTIGSITYLPRQDGNPNGRIGQHVISIR